MKQKVLPERKLEAIAQLIKEGKCTKIITMTGAGISTAAGIPDFRTPGTGLYDNLQKYNLPYPEAIFDISYFKDYPDPFFALAKELFPGKFLASIAPTKTHYFLVLLHRKKLLHRAFTQNIDTLERLAGMPDEKIVEAHGSFAGATCIRCGKAADQEMVKETILRGDIPNCGHCGKGIIKPNITFFGEALPEKFYDSIVDFKPADLLIVIGTSLQVQPFASLIDQVGKKVPRLLINREKAGVYEFRNAGFDFDGKYQPYGRDVFHAGNCDDGVVELCRLLGWEDELETLYQTNTAKLRENWAKQEAKLRKTVEEEEEELVEALARTGIADQESEKTEKVDVEGLAEDIHHKVELVSQESKNAEVQKETEVSASKNEAIATEKKPSIASQSATYTSASDKDFKRSEPQTSIPSDSKEIAAPATSTEATSSSTQKPSTNETPPKVEPTVANTVKESKGKI
ncbi:hypothetical protein BZG36_02808 [Bifiguratus adelaidae]|uniref:Deacetylase sirtuin-type domain-containing protein n=1 Tax=Bifiguratus adelaidae TaxID=1938954 RepID=A0A261Y1G2_9FUNG|nr:hypothetical protein BZG36_02808 [Bifiguratus adelaidae]